MRLLRLDLTAFGPFSGASLDFSAPADRPGVHVVYGPNEAGKSSTMRALRAALFGFPQQTADDFVHKYQKLRVGATVQADGQTLPFVRRKGRKETLLAVDGKTPLPDDALRPYLGSVKEDEFLSMFAIGHAELRAGGQEILKGQGRLSELLFMTAAGLPRLGRAERSLAEEAEALFKPQGTTPPINTALLRIAELTATVKERSLPASEYRRTVDALDQAKLRRAATDRELTERRLRRTRLERLSASLPAAARWKQARSELEPLRDVPQLPEGFTKGRETLEKEARSLTGGVEHLRSDLDRTVNQLAAITVPGELLAAGSEIDLLKERLGSHKTAASHLPQRQSEATAVERDIANLLREVHADLSLDRIETLKLTRPEQATVRELAGRIGELTTAIRKHVETIRRLSERIAQATAGLERLGPESDAERLRRALKSATRQGDLDALVAAAESEASDLERRLDTGLSTLPLWSGSVDELVRLPVPSAATIERFEAAMNTLDQETARLRDRRSEAERKLQEAERQREHAARDGEVPDERSLHESRRRRETGWREVRRELEGEGPGPARADFLANAVRTSLPDAYEAAVRTADEIADRMRHEAEQVERIASLQRDAQANRTELEGIAARETDLRRRREEHAADWVGQWRSLSPLSPREMRDWSLRHADLLRLNEQRLAAAAKAAGHRRQLETHRTDLAAALPGDRRFDGDDGSLRPLLDHAERLVAEIDAAAEERRSLVGELERAERDLRETELAADADRQEFAAVNGEWNDWKTRLGLPESARRDAVLTVLDTLAEVFSKLDKLESLRERIDGMRKDADRFAADVEEAVSRVAPDLIGRPFAEAAGALHDRLIAARSLNERRDELSRRREELDAKTADAARRLTEIDAELRQLCRQAGCEEPDELPAVEQHAALRRRVEAQLEQAEEDLRKRSGGKTVSELVADIDAANPDAIEIDLEQVKADEVGLVEQFAELAGVVARHEQDLSRMTGGAEAVTAAEDAEAVVARLAADVERYARLRFAAKLLRDGRERFRQRTGNAVLDRAGELFARLTAGSFTGLTVDYGENDEPLLVGVRSDESQVGVAGMSDGTADQLYLALRLAALSAWLDNHDSLPFVVDDILVHFDDARSAAALTALAALAERTQVILFTHHLHVKELAVETLPADILHIHDLGAAQQSAEPTPADGRAMREPIAADGASKRSLF